MSVPEPSTRGEYYRALKEMGVKFSKHYREYSTEELASTYNEAINALAEAGLAGRSLAGDEASEVDWLKALPDPETTQAEPMPATNPTAINPHASIPKAPKDEGELPGMRMNAKAPTDPIRRDEAGRIWLQEEVQKPSGARPRARRVIKYLSRGVRKERVVSGNTTEYFEVEGEGEMVTTEAKVTLPTYQVGIYIDPRYPFKVLTYRGQKAFDRKDVEKYYGGADLVPDRVKKARVANLLGYDMRSVVAAIIREAELRGITGKAIDV